MSFFSKKFEYDAGGRGIYEINSPAFSQEYVIQRENEGETVATFERTSGWLHSGAYCLENYSTQLGDYELVAVRAAHSDGRIQAPDPASSSRVRQL